jgi:signal transduction histidine kinase
VLNDGRDVFGREKKGGRIPLFMTLGRISDEEPRRYCAVLRDLTAWKRAEAELTEARRLAESANAKKSNFLAKISHEIRTPMNAIIGFAEVMMEERLGPIGNPKYKEYLGDIRTSGKHVVSLVNDLLDLAKIEAGRMEMNFAATDLNAVLSSTIGIIQPQANANRVLVRTQLAQKLPQVVADERSIRQIILNMLSNATRFTESGGQVIVATTLLETGEAVIRIRDTGVGMSPSEIEQALEPFRQVGTRRDHGGTGLGLPLTKALVEANRASFAIRSAPGEGTMVEIIFPSTRVLAE